MGGNLWLIPRLRSQRRKETLIQRNRWVHGNQSNGTNPKILGEKELIDIRQKKAAQGVAI